MNSSVVVRFWTLMVKSSEPAAIHWWNQIQLNRVSMTFSPTNLFRDFDCRDWSSEAQKDTVAIALWECEALDDVAVE
jgi:hypothetical protein